MPFQNCSLTEDTAAGIADRLAFFNRTASLSKADAELAAAPPPPSEAAAAIAPPFAYLTVHDYHRLEAHKSNLRFGTGQSLVAWVQATALVFSLLASVVLGHVAELSLSDIVFTRNITAWEVVSAVALALLASLAFVAGSLATLGDAGVDVLIYLVFLLIPVILVASWRIAVAKRREYMSRAAVAAATNAPTIATSNNTAAPVANLAGMSSGGRDGDNGPRSVIVPFAAAESTDDEAVVVLQQRVKTLEAMMQRSERERQQMAEAHRRQMEEIHQLLARSNAGAVK